MRTSNLPDGTPCSHVHTLVVGSGAAGLNAAVQLHAQGVEDLAIVTEGLQMGTSINAGSDKQTYYKTGMYGPQPDSIHDVAHSLFAGGSMHGDLALVEAAVSARAFLNLVNLGVPFPRDAYGQYVGYKTDHDPRSRATSVGPYTSREMCRRLIGEVARRSIPVVENLLATTLLTIADGPARRACGILAIETGGAGDLRAFLAENVVFAVGGPGGLYRTSVYPTVHSGGIGVALLAGARAQSLPESQYGLASTKFRWNVSGTYMQVIPRFISTAADGGGPEVEFLRPYYASPGQMHSAVFLKGYQWPFDPRKAVDGSSLLDILVYVETVGKGRRVFLDFRRDPDGFDANALSKEALEYLTCSEAILPTPIERLQKMNPGAIQLYAEHGIDIRTEPLEIAVSAQHNNGGLAANHWWESTSLKHLFPIGEVNGSHGVYRPGGSALNSGQVGGFRASEYVANRYRGETLDRATATAAAAAAAVEVTAWLAASLSAPRTWSDELDALRRRMSASAAHVRAAGKLAEAAAAARAQWDRLRLSGCSFASRSDAFQALNARQLCFAHVVYLEAIRAAVDAGVGSRGSALVLSRDGVAVHEALGDDWRFVPEDESFKDRVLETDASPDGSVVSRWVPRRTLPETRAWFETAWAQFRAGAIYD